MFFCSRETYLQNKRRAKRDLYRNTKLNIKKLLYPIELNEKLYQSQILLEKCIDEYKIIMPITIYYCHD